MLIKRSLHNIVCFFCVFFGYLASSYLHANEYYSFRFTHPTEALHVAQRFLPEDPIIIDAGAFDGFDSGVMASRWPKGYVHAFEPVPELYKRVLKTTKPFSNIVTYNSALSDKDGIAEMYISEFANLLEGYPDLPPGTPSHSSSLLLPKEHLDYAPHVVFPKSIRVNTYKLDTWAQSNNIDRVDMLWLDMQGVELNVLMASPKILKTTRVILTEVEFVEAYAGQYLYEDVIKWMDDNGFVLVGSNFDPDFPRNNSATYCGDAIFVRKELLTID